MWKQHSPELGTQPRRWGHSVCLVAREFLVVWGGLKDGDMCDDLHIYHLSTRRWKSVDTSGERPSPRWGASLSPHPSNAWAAVLLGGRQGSKPMPLSEYFVLDLADMSWARYDVASLEDARKRRPDAWGGLPQPHGVAASGCPKNRYTHTAVTRYLDKQVLVYGGHGGRTRYFSDVGVLQLPGSKAAEERVTHTLAGGGFILPTACSSATAALPAGEGESVGGSDDGAVWLPVRCSGSAPPRRSGHASAVVGEHLVVSGGYNGKAVLSDLWLLHMPTLRWDECKLQAGALPPLTGHSLVAVPHSPLLVVFGGSTSRSRLSLAAYLLDVDARAASAVTPRLSPSARFWHRSVHVDGPGDRGSMLMLGGVGASGTALGDLFTLDLDTLTRSALAAALRAAGGSVPARLADAARKEAEARREKAEAPAEPAAGGAAAASRDAPSALTAAAAGPPASDGKPLVPPPGLGHPEAGDGGVDGDGSGAVADARMPPGEAPALSGAGACADGDALAGAAVAGASTGASEADAAAEAEGGLVVTSGEWEAAAAGAAGGGRGDDDADAPGAEAGGAAAAAGGGLPGLDGEAPMGGGGFAQPAMQGQQQMISVPVITMGPDGRPSVIHVGALVPVGTVLPPNATLLPSGSVMTGGFPGHADAGRGGGGGGGGGAPTYGVVGGAPTYGNACWLEDSAAIYGAPASSLAMGNGDVPSGSAALDALTE
ncbi:hypothetical protein FNF29_01884 [Cafeteria roenbergensis]|uniref:Uncharacterized protein n=1 Tax=Cafeteria roenbergensis TaxID=33653 RepID=A0A5A8CPZ9_CAFRO|nr:hypothetical protein FNF29_01884 [Cafeteria roenbergensis]|eukprot:KAA0155133.1 hypothetical protein FNF29_01884 [Cafeteria roenbergensis]